MPNRPRNYHGVGIGSGLALAGLAALLALAGLAALTANKAKAKQPTTAGHNGKN